MNVYTYLQKTLYVCSTGQNTTPGNLAYPYLNKTQIPCYWIPKMVEKPVICERTLRTGGVVRVAEQNGARARADLGLDLLAGR